MTGPDRLRYFTARLPLPSDLPDVVLDSLLAHLAEDWREQVAAKGGVPVGDVDVQVHWAADFDAGFGGVIRARGLVEFPVGVDLP